MDVEMTITRILRIASLVLLSTALFADDGAAIEKLERRLRENPKAVSINDLKSILADNYSGIDSYGQTSDKKTVLEAYQKAQNDGIAVPAAKITEISVVPEGASATVTGKYTLEIEGSPEISFDDSFRKIGGRWQLVRSREQKSTSANHGR